MSTVIAALALFGMGSVTQTATSPERFEQKIPGHLPSFWLRKIPAGEITIGAKKVAVTSLWVAETEVTWDIYDIFAFRLDLTPKEQATGVDATARPSKPYGAPDRGFGHQSYAALGMTANSAQKFCDWLNKKTGRKFRLATEAEWEYAARAGSTATPKLDEVAWYFDNGEDQTHPVGTLKPNAWGLFDTLGNAAEWAIDLKGVPVTCGGSYATKADKTTFGTRQYYEPSWQDADAHVPKSKWWLSDGPFVGMRIVCDP